MASTVEAKGQDLGRHRRRVMGAIAMGQFAAAPLIGLIQYLNDTPLIATDRKSVV